jgi:hypothetical protein
MKHYRKKPVVIQAIQWDGTPEGVMSIKNFIDYTTTLIINSEYLTIETLEGDMKVMPNDWVIKGVNGEFYPCKPDIFEKTYEDA